jgi:hypothetical protein
LVPQDFEEQIVGAQIRVADPSKAFEQVVLKFAPQPISFPPAFIERGHRAEASLGKNVAIGPMCGGSERAHWRRHSHWRP